MNKKLFNELLASLEEVKNDISFLKKELAKKANKPKPVKEEKYICPGCKKKITWSARCEYKYLDIYYTRTNHACKDCAAKWNKQFYDREKKYQ